MARMVSLFSSALYRFPGESEHGRKSESTSWKVGDSIPGALTMR
jgi:hypothetical protein